VANNNQIADLVLIQIKALFASSLAKIQFSPAAQPNLSLVTRDVLIPTKDRAGTGDAFLHPGKPDYNNPIQAIHFYGGAYFKFESKDGIVSQHPGCTYQFKKVEISPKDSQITKIQVWQNDSHMTGFKLFNNDVVVLEAG
jgi:hypothetical protein